MLFKSKIVLKARKNGPKMKYKSSQQAIIWDNKGKVIFVVVFESEFN